jgi:hypothetical protein
MSGLDGLAGSTISVSTVYIRPSGLRIPIGCQASTDPKLINYDKSVLKQLAKEKKVQDEIDRLQKQLVDMQNEYDKKFLKGG